MDGVATVSKVFGCCVRWTWSSWERLPAHHLLVILLTQGWGMTQPSQSELFPGIFKCETKEGKFQSLSGSKGWELPEAVAPTLW